MEPLISVIVPYKDSARWIGRCIDSLERQRGNFEFIFINDWSNDEGPEILKTHTDTRIIRADNQWAEGVSGARNMGLDMASGEWITFLDADDELMPDAYIKFLKMIKTEPLIHQSNHIRYYVGNNRATHQYDNPEGIYTLQALPKAWYGVWNKLYKSELVKGIRFDTSMQYGEDELFNLECLSIARKIHHGSDTTVKHNIENKASLSHIRTDADLIREIQKLGDFMESHKDKELRSVVYDLMILRLKSGWYRKAICG